MLSYYVITCVLVEVPEAVGAGRRDPFAALVLWKVPTIELALIM